MIDDDGDKLPLTEWLEQTKDGDPAAFEQLWRHYHRSLVGLARKALASSPARSADEEDIVQSALTSFYYRAQEGRFPDLRDHEGLWRLLITMTLNKARALDRKEGRRQEILARERPRIVPTEPTPEIAAEFAEQLNLRLQQLTDESLRRIAIAKLEGYTNQEIAEQLSRSVPTIERKLRLIRQLWSCESSL